MRAQAQNAAERPARKGATRTRHCVDRSPRCLTPTAKEGRLGDEQRLTNTSFNILDAPGAPGHFLGDYMGLAASGSTTVYPVFGIATGKNVTANCTRSISGLP